jgi:hypothetical protein
MFTFTASQLLGTQKSNNQIESITDDHNEVAAKKIKLIDSEICSDIKLLLGQHRSPINAHKIILIGASDYFKGMFCGDLKANSNELAIEAIEKDVFLLILKFIYADEIDFLDNSNMLEILKAADFLLLQPLKRVTIKFIEEHTTESNFMKVFNETHLLTECESIEKKCMDFMLSNPMLHFENPYFLDLEPTAIKNLVQQPAINCTSYDLKKAVEKWMDDLNDDRPYCWIDELTNLGLKMTDFEPKSFYKVDTNSPVYYEKQVFRTNVTYVRSMNKWLLGVGLHVGVYEDSKPFDELVKITFEQPLGSKSFEHAERDILQTNQKSVVDVMFKKMYVHTAILKVQVEFQTDRTRTATKTGLCVTNHNHSVLSCEKYSEVGHDYTCLAYLIWSK